MTTELDRAFDHAAMIGASIRVRPPDEPQHARWAVGLVDRFSGNPEGYGRTVEDAARALMRSIDAQTGA